MEVNRIVNEALTNELANITQIISDKYDIEYEELNQLISGFVPSEHLGPLNTNDKRASTGDAAVPKKVKSAPKKVVRRVVAQKEGVKTRKVIKPQDEGVKTRKVIKPRDDGDETPSKPKRVVRRVVKKPKPAPEPKSDSEEAPKLCPYMSRNSDGVEVQCQSIIDDELTYCAKHEAITKRLKRPVQPLEPELVEESQEPLDEGSETVVVLRKNKWGNTEHYPTHFVFDSENRVIGKQANSNNVLPLTDDDMRSCQERNWDYVEPGDSE
jgi:hypothetical protein